MNKTLWREVRNGLIIGVVLVVAGTVTAVHFFNFNPPYDPTHVRPFLADLFCPEKYEYSEDNQIAVDKAMRSYMHRYPDASAEEVLRWRYRFLVEHKCEETLAKLRAKGLSTEDDYAGANTKIAQKGKGQ